MFGEKYLRLEYCGWRTWRICGKDLHSPRRLRGFCRLSSRRAWPRRRRSRVCCGSASLCRGCLCSQVWAAARTATSRSLSAARFSASETAAPSRLRLGPPAGRVGCSRSCSQRPTRSARTSPPRNPIPRQGQAQTRWSSRSHPRRRHRPRVMTTVLESPRAPISPLHLRRPLPRPRRRLRGLRFPRRRHHASQIRSPRRRHLPRFQLIRLHPRIPMARP